MRCFNIFSLKKCKKQDMEVALNDMISGNLCFINIAYLPFKPARFEKNLQVSNVLRNNFFNNFWKKMMLQF